MRFHDDPASMTADERFRELARILAASLLRRRACPSRAPDSGTHPNPKNLPQTVQDCLEVPAQTVLSVHTG
jgi:hypothetical protein